MYRVLSIALLEPASRQLAGALEGVSFPDFTCPLIGNTEAAVMEKDQIQELLRQVKEPVRFMKMPCDAGCWG